MSRVLMEFKKVCLFPFEIEDYEKDMIWFIDSAKRGQILSRRKISFNQMNTTMSSQALEYQDRYFWISLAENSYLHEKSIDYLIQETENEFLFFSRDEFSTFVYSKIPQDYTKTVKTFNEEAIYGLLQITRKELATLVPHEDVLSLVRYSIPK
jgi:hypothetical protein